METKYIVLSRCEGEFQECDTRLEVEGTIADYLDNGTGENNIVVYEVARIVPFTAILDDEYSRVILGA